MKVRYALAALACIAVAAPSLASAETTVIKKGGDFDRARAELRGDFHRHHFDRDFDRDRKGDFDRTRAELRGDFHRHQLGRDHEVVIIKHRHHHHMDY